MSLLRVAALEGAFELVDHLTTFDDVAVPEAIAQLRQGPSDVARFDYTGAAELLHLCGPAFFSSANRSTTGHRRIVSYLVAAEAPTWRLAAAKGKKWCRNAMDENSAQTIGWANLWDMDDEALDWWFQLATAARGQAEAARAAVGRIGERLTFEHECGRLQALGAPCVPVWRSTEDDTLGYDIESWEYSPGSEPLPLRIEVKAYAGADRRFFLTRGEWRTALRFRAGFAVDLWDVSTKTLTRFAVEQVKKAIPAETPAGEWQTLLVLPDML